MNRGGATPTEPGRKPERPRIRAARDTIEPPPVFDNKFDQFKYWFSNVYWYHYKWHTFAVIVCALIVFSIIATSINRRDPDLTIVFVSEYSFDIEYAETLSKELEDRIKDITGKETADVDLSLLMVNENSEAGMANTVLFSVQLTRDDTLLFIFQDTILEGFMQDNSFQNLSQYGFDDETLIDVSENEKIKALCYNQDMKFFAGFLNKDIENETIKELSVAALEYLR